MAEGILTLNPITPERDPDQLGGPGYIEAPLGAGIGLALANMFKDKNKENLPEEVDKEKTPQEEPPKGPDIGEEILTNLAIKEVEKKVKEKQPINKIQTWDKYFDSKEEAEKAAINAGGTLEEFEQGVIQKQITFRKHGYGYDIFFDKKRVGELLDITSDLIDFGTRTGNKNTFNLVFIDEDGANQRDAISTIDGLSYAKERAKELIAEDLLRDTTEPLYPSLKDIFQNLQYDKKGEPAKLQEEIKKIREGSKDGGLIDKPLPGRSRDI